MPRPPRHCSPCWIAALPVASQRNLLQRPRAPLEYSQSTPRVLLEHPWGGPNRTSGSGCIAAQPAAMHRPAASLHRQLRAAASVAAQCVRSAGQRSLVRLTPIRPHLRLEAALIAHHRTGLIPAHICTGPSPPPTHICNLTESIPCPPLHRERVHPPPTSAPQTESIPREHLRHHCCPPSRSHARCCVSAQRSAAWDGSPLYARICILGRRSSLTTGLGSLPPTSALGLSRSLAHLCTAKESVPRRHLRRHCCPPGHLPLRNTSVTQQRSRMCCNHTPCVATECHL
jgi:hypothetical protein